MRPSALFVTIVVSTIYANLTAQDTLWYNAQWELCPRHKALYFRPQPVKEGNRYRVLDYYINGVKQYEGYSLEMDSNVQDGVAVWFYPDGDTSAISTYTQGSLNGLTKTYYNNRQTHGTRYYKNGKVQGMLTEYFPNGNVSGFTQYQEGNLHGLFVKYYHNGKVKYAGNYIHNKRDSTWVEFYPSGNIKSLYDFKDDVVEGRSHQYSDIDKYYAKFTVQNGTATSVEIYDAYRDRQEWRRMSKEGDLERWRVYSDSVLVFEYFFEGLTRVGVWTDYSYDGTEVKEQFTHTSQSCQCNKTMLHESLFGKDMSLEKVNATYMKECETYTCLNGVSYLTMKNGKKKKFEYKNGIEKPEMKQEDLLNSIGGRFTIVKLRDLELIEREPKIDSLPVIANDTITIDNHIFAVKTALYQGIPIKVYTSPNAYEAVHAWQKTQPQQNELLALLSTEYPYYGYINTGNSLSVKLKHNLYDRREFTSCIRKLCPESNTSFQVIYKGMDEATKQIRIENKYPSPGSSARQIKTAPVNNNPVFTFAEQMPEFPGGSDALMRFIGENVKYPPLARDNDIEGKVFVRFVVYDTGEIGSIEVVKGADPSLDQEAVRVISEMPFWKPAMQQGKAVNCYYTIPINFRLN